METTAPVIVVVDDDRDFLSAVERNLVRRGYSTLAASHPFEALEKSRDYKGHIELLLTDVSMPDMDGIMLAEHIVVQRPDICVLLMSACATIQSRFPLLTKPFPIADLLEHVSQAIANSPSCPSFEGAPKDSFTSSVGSALAAEVDEALRRYLDSSRSLLALTQEVPSGIPSPDGALRIHQSADCSKRDFEEYQRAQKKLTEYMRIEQCRIESEPEP